MKKRLVSIRDCAVVLPGFSSKGAMVNESAGTHQVIIARHLTDSLSYCYQEMHHLRITPERSAEKYLLKPGDILFMSRGANNYAVVLESFPQPAIAPLTFFVLKSRQNVRPHYLAWCLNQPPVQSRIGEIRTGAATPMIPRPEFSDIVIPLPTLEEQDKIVLLARLMEREKILRRQLLEETEMLHKFAGTQIIHALEKNAQR